MQLYSMCVYNMRCTQGWFDSHNVLSAGSVLVLMLRVYAFAWEALYWLRKQMSIMDNKDSIYVCIQANQNATASPYIDNHKCEVC